MIQQQTVELNPPAAELATAPAPAPDEVIQDAAVIQDPIEVIKARSPEGLGFHFKVRATGVLFRFEPTRHPREPRFWCFSIFRCISAGSPDLEAPKWISDVQMTREELPAAVQAVRADLVGWLSDESRGDIRDWVFAQIGRAPLKQEVKNAKKAPVS
jgi:hypothetical protein